MALDEVQLFGATARRLGPRGRHSVGAGIELDHDAIRAMDGLDDRNDLSPARPLRPICGLMLSQSPKGSIGVRGRI